MMGKAQDEGFKKTLRRMLNTPPTAHETSGKNTQRKRKTGKRRVSSGNGTE